MSSNQSGSGRPDNEDPWNRNSQGQRLHGEGPPDLDEILRIVRARFNTIFGGNSNGPNAKSGKSMRFAGGGVIGLGLLVVISLWLFSGIYTVDQGERAIELRFGKYLEENGAGLHWHIPTPIETVTIINTQQVNTVEVGYRKGGSNLTTVAREALMLTQDENIIDVQFAVQYDVKSPTDLLFNVSEFNVGNMAESVVRQATESAVREIVGRNSMDFAITEGRAQLAAETKSLVQQILDRYQTGINVRTVEMQNAQPPLQVKNAFDDVVRAREDEERIKNLAQAYANDIIPRARGFAARIQQESLAYKESTIAQAEGQAARFDQVLIEYLKAPQITRDRLYLQSMEKVLQKSSKVFIDQLGGNSVMYLPIDQLIRNRSSDSNAREETSSDSSTNSANIQDATLGRNSNRTRRN